MSVSFRRLAGVLAVLVLAACQPSLKSQLPTGEAAYQSIQATTQPAAMAGPYMLRAGDHVAVNVYQEQELTQPDVPIDEAGKISLPLIGEVQAAGRTVASVAADVQSAYGRRYLRDPKVNVMLKQAGARTYSVEGQVNKPGLFAYEPGNSLLTALAMAGSPSNDAKLNEVLVFRNINGERLGGRFNLTDIRAGRAPDPQILPGDVVVVGFSAVRGAYRDILQAAPIFGLFTQF